MSVKRYGLSNFDSIANIRQMDDGEYVLHSDYATLAAQNRAMREFAEQAMIEIRAMDKLGTNPLWGRLIDMGTKALATPAGEVRP